MSLDVLQRAGIPVVAFDRDGRYVFINDAAERLFGVRQAERLGQHYQDAAGSSWDSFHAVFEDVRRDGQTRSFRLALDARHFEIDLCVGIDDGRERIIAHVREVTDRVLLHDTVAFERDRWEVLFEQAPVQISVTLGPEHRCVYVNSKARAAVGGRTDLVGKTPRESFPELADSPLHATLDEVYRTGRPFVGTEVPVPFARADGKQEERYFTFIYQPFRDAAGHVIGMMSFGFEVTDTVRSRKRLETLFQSNLIGNITWKLDGTLTGANDTFLSMVGYTRDELVRGIVSWRALSPPGYAAMDAEKVEELLARRAHTPYEKHYVHKDGTHVPILVSSAMFPDSEDEGISYIVDLSSVKRAELEIRRLLANAQAASKAKDQFLAMLGHELRNPLAPIVTALDLMKMRGANGPEMGTLERQVAHMIRLVDDLLDVGRIARGEIRVDKRPVPVRRLIERAVEIADPLLERRRHRLTVTMPEATTTILGDEARLTQALSNLLVNAARYTPPGGTISVTGAARSSEHVELTIVDSGRGMPADVLAHVFEPFFRAESSPGDSGLGLGLAIVRSIVQLHGGTVHATSPGLGHGSTFTVTLPRSADLLRPSTPAMHEHLDGGRATRRVLVVDDNVDAAELLGALISQYGHDVSIAYDGHEALRLVDDWRPDVVLLDLYMPTMDGFEVARELRARHGDRTRLVAVTGYGQERDRVATRDAGFDGHLVKPVTIEHVLRELTPGQVNHDG